ncbi:MAG TPA: hypothetical protein VNW46_16645, partial [Gemmatimonadaceae bacterium]|nr:hypothetical protein [Gemmatimonadaceae bacterium]
MVIDPVSGFVGCVAGVGAAAGVQRLREYRREPVGLADVLNWGFLVGDGIVLQKDGSLVAGFAYRGPDLNASSALELGALARQVHDAILPYGSGWMFHVDAVRRPAVAYAASVFPNAVAAAIDEERRTAYDRGGRRFETTYAFVVTHRPAEELTVRTGRWFVRGSQVTGVDWDAIVGRFDAAVETVLSRLRGRLWVERLGSDALVTHLHECVTGLGHRVRAPDHGAYLDLMLGDQSLVGGFEPRIGERHVRVVGITAFPRASRPGALDFLGTLPCAYRWSTRLLMLGPTEAAREIRRQQLRWFQKRRGMGAWARDMAAKQGAGSTPSSPQEQANEELFQDHDAVRMAKDAGEAAAELASGAVRFCYATQVIVVTDPDPVVATDVARLILGRCADEGYGGRIESVNAVEAYLGSLPGHGYQNLRRVLVSTRN